MDIAIVSSFYNGYDRFIPAWIMSIINLSVPPKQVVLVASGVISNEKNIEFAETQLKKENIEYNIIRLDKHKSMGYARNQAVFHANTEWIMYLDIDDVILPDALKYIQEYDREDIDVICTGLRITGFRQKQDKLFIHASAEAVLQGKHCSCSHSVYRKKFWEKSPYIEYNDFCEQALWIGFAHLGANFKGINKVCTMYVTRRSGHNKSMTIEDRRVAKKQRLSFLKEGVKH